MEFKSHLDNIILKSTFKVSESTDPDYNCFIDPTGHIISCESHHHVEIALEIIKDIDKGQKNRYKGNLKILDEKTVELAKLLRLKNLYESDPNLIVTKKTVPRNAWYYTDWINSKVKINQLESRIEVLKDGVKLWEKYSNDAKLDIYELKKFEASNKNKGYDAAEYLIINLGYIAVESGNLLYDSRHSISSTQLKELKVKCIHYGMDDIKYILVPKTPKDLKEERDKEIAKLKEQSRWFSTSESRFHCPSGFPRRSYLEWRSKCRKLGIQITD